VAAWSGWPASFAQALFIRRHNLEIAIFSIPALNHSSGERSIVDLTTDRPSLKENRNDQDATMFTTLIIGLIAGPAVSL